jgi:hypothetical protein
MFPTPSGRASTPVRIASAAMSDWLDDEKPRQTPTALRGAARAASDLGPAIEPRLPGAARLIVETVREITGAA